MRRERFSPRVAFIDSRINIAYIDKLLKSNQKICSVLSVYNGKVIPSENFPTEDLTHATICTKSFMNNYIDSCYFVFIEILDDFGSKANIMDLLLALEWCLQNKIVLINLSIGTTSFIDMLKLHEEINKLTSRGVIIVAACSNRNKMTFPAVFSNVIGVRALNDKFEKNSFEFYENNIDRIDVVCHISEEIVKYKNKYYTIPCSNSLAAPVISAKVCDFINKGYNSIPKLKNKLKEESLRTNCNPNNKVYKKYFKGKTRKPILLIMDSETNLLLQTLLLNFEKYGYSGVCLSEKYETNISMRIINLQEFNIYSLTEKIHFYGHYCNVDYIILQMENNRLLSQLKLRDMDIFISKSEVENFKYKKNIKYINLSHVDDYNILFKEIYNYLLEE